MARTRRLSSAQLDRLTVAEVGLDYLLAMDDRHHFLSPEKRAALDVLHHKDPFTTFGETWTPGDGAAAGRRAERLKNVVDRLTEAFPE